MQEACLPSAARLPKRLHPCLDTYAIAAYMLYSTLVHSAFYHVRLLLQRLRARADSLSTCRHTAAA